jgi:hypothetical protein
MSSKIDGKNDYNHEEIQAEGVEPGGGPKILEVSQVYT